MNNLGLGQKTLVQKPPDKKTPNNEKYMLMFFVSYIYFIMCLCLIVRIWKKKCVLWHDSRFCFTSLIHCTLYLCILPQTTFVFLHAFWTYCTAIYVFTLFLNTIFHNSLLLEHEDIINNWSIFLRIIITLIKESKKQK
jgi:hypothetical protein